MQKKPKNIQKKTTVTTLSAVSAYCCQQYKVFEKNVIP